MRKAETNSLMTLSFESFCFRTWQAFVVIQLYSYEEKQVNNAVKLFAFQSFTLSVGSSFNSKLNEHAWKLIFFSEIVLFSEHWNKQKKKAASSFMTFSDLKAVNASLVGALLNDSITIS